MQRHPPAPSAAAGSAASMLQTAEAIVKHASTGTRGVQVVSDALLGHADAPAQRTFIMPGAAALAMSRSPSNASSTDDVVGARRPSATPAELDYAARMRVHVGGVLQAQAQSRAAAATGSTATTATNTHTAPPDLPPLVLGVDQMHVRTIAACTAAQEGKEQLRVHALIRSGGEGGTAAGSASQVAAPSAQPSASQVQSSVPSPQSPLPLTPQTVSFDAYLAHLGLEHIPLPSDGFEQQWGVRGTSTIEAPTRGGPASLPWKQRRWDHPEAGLGFSLSGVPSLPLMPRPPLQMLPPPSSPSLLRSTNPGTPHAGSYPFPLDSPVFQQHSHSWAAASGSSSSASSTASGFFTPGTPRGGPHARRREREPHGAGASTAAHDETRRFPFQVVQTPGGTARPGWWVPSSAVSPRRRASVAAVQSEALQGPSSGGSAQNTAPHQGQSQAQSQMLFQPSYHIFTMEEYAALASAAAYATAALTSTHAADGQSGTLPSVPETSGAPSASTAAQEKSPSPNAARWRALSPAQQAEIAAQLRAWAGLEGPAAQEEARKSLEMRQQLIRSAVQGGERRGSAESGGEGGAQEADQVPSIPAPAPPPTSFFPPDFASHYRAQLSALAEGYYKRLHSDGLRGMQRLDATQRAEERRKVPAPAPMEVDRDTPVPMSGVEATAGAQAPTKPTRSDSSTPLGAGASTPLAPTGAKRERDSSRSPNAPAEAREGHEGKRRFDGSALGPDLAAGARAAPDLATTAPVPPPLPVTEEGGAPQDPMQLIAAASNAAGLDVHSAELRDQLLQYAHGLYSSGGAGDDKPAQEGPEAKTAQSGGAGKQAQPPTSPSQKLQTLHPTLLPLLHTLLKLHPRHLPTLLLLSCAYYTSGNLDGSLWYNNAILEIDPHYVEAMSNIGTTLRALGRWKEAESWWWRAIHLRPSYWDATENLLGVLCYPRQAPQDKSNGAGVGAKGTSQGDGKEGAASENDGAAEEEQTGPRFHEALRLCEFVEQGLALAPRSASPVRMPSRLSVVQTPRLQNLFYAKGNLKYVLPEHGPVAAAREYEKAVEVAVSPAGSTGYSVRDLAIATCVVGLLSMGAVVPGSAAANAATEVAAAIGLDPQNARHESIATSGTFAELVPGGIMRLVKRAGDHLVSVLLRLGGGQLPMIMLLPESAVQTTKYLFAESEGVLPTMVPDGKTKDAPGARSAQNQQALLQAMHTTSTVLLTLAKLSQDATARPTPGPHGPLTLGGIPPSTSLVLSLYYLSLSLQPSASTCNNAGILLSSVPVVTTMLNAAGQRQQLNGQALAMQYYMYGLQLDARHTHLYTNLGSLLKDLGHLSEAILMYEKAVDCNPNFDVALANLGNAIKDQGRTQDSVVYYRRAVQINPNFPEALCGLVNALLAVCDWREVYSEDPAWKGWMADVLRLVETQLDDGAQYGAGALMASGTIETWVERIVAALHDPRAETKAAWTRRLEPFYAPLDRAAHKVNEGSFVIRLVERLLRRSQRQWYLDRYGGRVYSDEPLARIEPTQVDVERYPTIALPPSLITPAIPTVLPFHTFTAKGLTPRQIRLISHRNALRISQTTLTQTWRPPHVYPPPPPPAPRLRVGYVSSDLNNHPLAHLMQSVFGMHDAQSFEVFCYATTPSDGSPYRLKIEREAHHFVDVSSWSHAQLVARILADGIHILMNLNGYTKGARNEVFAARPCPVQMEFMGFAGGLASSWTDWIVADPIVCPPEMTSVDHWRRERGLSADVTPTFARPTHFGGDLDPEDPSEDWAYNDRFIYMPHSYFVNDHAQGFREPDARPRMGGQGVSEVVKPHEMSDEDAWAEEEERRWQYRRDLFPSVPDDFVIFADFNQLYKCDPELLRLWLRVLKRVPRSILWLLRFPAAGEAHLVRAAREWGGDDVAARIVFTDVAPKHVHIHRGRIADVFLDTLECNAHTTAADILWSATPVVTWPRHAHKMCSNVAASIVQATGLGEQMVVHSEEEYEERAVQLANSLQYTYVDRGGKPLEAVVTDDIVGADSLRADPAAATARPHGTGTEQAGASQSSSRAPSSSMSTTSRIDAAMAVDAAPAPANVGADKAASEARTHDDANVWGASPPRSAVLVAVGTRAPQTAVSRRSKGELATLRRALFVGRERSALFDTRAWVRALERGYREAWRRWVSGTDGEEWDEWAALGEDAEEVRSGHIWLQAE